MTEPKNQLPHRLVLNERTALTVTGVREVTGFDEETVVANTDLGTLVLQLKAGEFDCLAVADGNGDAIIAKNPEIAKSGFVFYVDPKETGNVIMLQKGADDLTNVVNEILAESEQYWEAWYADAQSISGIDQSYDDQGNAIT